jgi:Alpha-glutamyl/putrescinyl thymine pyrophosphorylase clade 3
MVRDVYSGLGGTPWTCDRVSNSPAAFRAWLTANGDRIGGCFGNHRKYESINGDRPSGTGAAVESYVAWVGPTRSHARHFAGLVREGGNDPNSIFDHFYRRMAIARFGRLGKFDFLCLLRRLGLAPIVPGRAYLKGATGPLRGARLLFGGDPEAPLRVPVLEGLLIELDGDLGVGMQVLEDSLCKWHESPTKFIHFKG